MSALEQYIKNILKSEDSEEKCDVFVSTFIKELDSDDESYSKKGYHMLKAIQENNIENFLIAVCGWNAESLLKKALVIPDENSDFNDEIIEAVFITEWDDGENICETSCKINTKTHEVFDIGCCPEHHLDDGFHELDGEYILIDDVQFNVYPKDQVDSDEGEFITSFWYGENE